MSDLISRMEMLRTYQELCMNVECSVCPFYFGDVLTGYCLLEKWVHSLPSAEKTQLSEEDATFDLISREDACEAVKNEMESWLEGDRCDYRNVVDAIMDLPSAEGCKCPCVYREPCDVCHYDGHLGMGCPAERRGEEDEIN